LCHDIILIHVPLDRIHYSNRKSEIYGFGIDGASDRPTRLSTIQRSHVLLPSPLALRRPNRWQDTYIQIPAVHLDAMLHSCHICIFERVTSFFAYCMGGGDYSLLRCPIGFCFYILVCVHATCMHAWIRVQTQHAATYLEIQEQYKT